MNRLITITLLLLTPLLCHSQNGISRAWVADNGDGTYTNPVINADYSDPDVCRVGEDYYMTASSFNCIPGLPVLHSKDMVNWTIVNHALPYRYEVEGGFDFSFPQHGNGVWAPSIRYNEGKYYIMWGDPDAGIFMVTAEDPAGEWSAPITVKRGLGLIDPCPLWDDDGRMYVVHGFAGSRAGMKSVLAIFETTLSDKPGVTVAASRPSVVIFDGHQGNPTIEGPKFHKKDGRYYIFAPAGGVATGWQLVMRSDNVYGPYEYRVAMDQGTSEINGPHQGAWVDTPDGKQDWFFHFQDKFAYGRVVHLQPMIWRDGWPVIGEPQKGGTKSQPVATYKKPNVGRTYPVATPADSDEFDSRTLGLQWQWHAGPNPLWYYTASESGVLRLYSVAEPDGYRNLYDAGNLLLQKTPADEFTATMKIDFHPLEKKYGERTGLLVMGLDYAMLSLENTKDGWVLSQTECTKADKGSKEVVNEEVIVNRGKTLYLQVRVSEGAICAFTYSTDNKRFKPLGKPFKAREGQWIGAKVGTFITRPFPNNDSGYVDIDWFRITK